MQDHMPILKKVGKVLIAVGLVDIGVMIYCIANDISYSSSLNIFTVIAGIFLMRGSLRAVAIVTWFGTFLLAGFICVAMLWPFLQTIDLTLLQLKLNPASFLIFLAIGILLLGLLYWVVRELRREPVLDARMQAGAKISSLRIPAVAGIVLVIGLLITIKFSLNGDTAQRVKQMAAKELGPGYKYNVNSMNIMLFFYTSCLILSV
jgi:hypothetical protein